MKREISEERMRMFGRPVGTVDMLLRSKGRGIASATMAAAFALPLAAQVRGPLPPPPVGTVTASAPPAQASAGPRERASHITNEPPAMPVDEIIQKFTPRKEEFRRDEDKLHIMTAVK